VGLHVGAYDAVLSLVDVPLAAIRGPRAVIADFDDGTSVPATYTSSVRAVAPSASRPRAYATQTRAHKSQGRPAAVSGHREGEKSVISPRWARNRSFPLTNNCAESTIRSRTFQPLGRISPRSKIHQAVLASEGQTSVRSIVRDYFLNASHSGRPHGWGRRNAWAVLSPVRTRSWTVPRGRSTTLHAVIPKDRSPTQRPPKRDHRIRAYESPHLRVLLQRRYVFLEHSTPSPR
jgi:hypothetical protein